MILIVQPDNLVILICHMEFGSKMFIRESDPYQMGLLIANSSRRRFRKTTLTLWREGATRAMSGRRAVVEVSRLKWPGE